MLTVDHVTKKYGRFTALEEVSITFRMGFTDCSRPTARAKPR